MEKAAVSAQPSHLQTFPTPSLITRSLLHSPHNQPQPPNPRVNPAPGPGVWNRQLTLGLFFMFRNTNKSHTIKFIIFSPQRNMKYYRSLHQFLHSLLARKVYFLYNLPSHWSNFSYFFWRRKHTDQILLLHITHDQPSCLPPQASRKSQSCWSWVAAQGGPDLGFLYRDSMKKSWQSKIKSIIKWLQDGCSEKRLFPKH